MKRFFGALLTIVGLLWGLLGVAMTINVINDWRKWGYHESDLNMFYFILLAFVLVGTLICIAGVLLLRNVKKTPTRSAISLADQHIEQEQSQTRSYLSSPKLQVAEFFKKTLFFLPLAFIATVPIPAENLENTPRFVLALILSAIFALFWAFYWCKIQIRIGPAGIQFFRGRRQYTSYSLNTPLIPTVIKNNVNNVFTGTNRVFRIPISKNSFKTVQCWCITKMDFSQLVEDIEKLRLDGTLERLETATTVETFFNENQTNDFIFPKRQILGIEKRNGTILSVLLYGVMLVLTLLWFLFLYKETMHAAMIVSLLVVALLPPTIYLLIFLGQYTRSSKKLAEHIILTSGSIRVDERSFSANELKTVTMTPPNYTFTKNYHSPHRRLVFHTADTSVEYYLGYTAGSHKKYLYENYEEVLSAIQHWCVEHRVNFMKDRG